MSLFFVSDGYYLYYLYLQQQQKHNVEQQIKNGIFDDDIEFISISSECYSNFSWHKYNKEFEYNGNLYDIVRIENTKAGRRYICIKDNVEKKLEARFHNNLRRKKKDLQKLRRKLNIKFLQAENVNNLMFKTKSLEYLQKLDEFTEELSEVISPPPRFYS